MYLEKLKRPIIWNGGNIFNVGESLNNACKLHNVIYPSSFKLSTSSHSTIQICVKTEKNMFVGHILPSSSVFFFSLLDHDC